MWLEECIRGWKGILLIIRSVLEKKRGRDRMESSDSHRSGLLTAGGILCIVGGAFAVISVVLAADILISNIESLSLDWLNPYNKACAIRSIIVATSVFALGIVTLVGGVSAMRRKKFGLSLAGAICFALTSPVAFSETFSESFFSRSLVELVFVWGWMILGILATIFVSLSRREFQG